MLEFRLPDFLDETDEEIHQRMLQVAPRNFDVSQGSLFYDVTMPTALEKARMIEYQMTLATLMMFPQFAEGIHLDYHAVREGITRRDAIKAIGEITVTGSVGFVIPRGSIFTTEVVNDEVPIEFETIEEALINEEGQVVISIQALTAGAQGNVPPDSISVIASSGLGGVNNVTNETATRSGVDIESDESFKARLLDRHKNKQLSGSVSDYITWAKEVPGVGEVIVLPEWDGPGTVKLMLTNSSGGVASPELIKSVEEYIAPDGGKGGGLAPIGAVVSFSSVDTKVINLECSLRINGDQEDIINEIKRVIQEYFNSVSINGVIRYSYIGSLILSVDGVTDYFDLKINDQTTNIDLLEGEIAELSGIEVTIYE